MSKTLLIIEDDPYVLRFYERLFRLHNCIVEMASSGEEGLEKAKKLKPPLILMDIMMPKMNGLEVLEKIKADPETKDSVVIMLSNFGEEEIIKKAKGLGAENYIIKSKVSDEELLAVVDKYIGTSTGSR